MKKYFLELLNCLKVISCHRSALILYCHDTYEQFFITANCRLRYGIVTSFFAIKPEANIFDCEEAFVFITSVFVKNIYNYLYNLF